MLRTFHGKHVIKKQITLIKEGNLRNLKNYVYKTFQKKLFFLKMFGFFNDKSLSWDFSMHLLGVDIEDKRFL